MNKTDSDFYWCLHCERTFEKGAERIAYDDELDFDVAFCPYDGCDSSYFQGVGNRSDSRERRF